MREKTEIVADTQPRFDVCRSTTNDGQRASMRYSEAFVYYRKVYLVIRRTLFRTGTLRITEMQVNGHRRQIL